MDVRAEVHHNVQPVIGWLRLAVESGASLTPEQMVSAVSKLYLALDAVDTLK